jgi:serine protease AprX
MMRRVFMALCAWLAICAGHARAAEFAVDGKLDAALLARARAARTFVAPTTSSRIIVRSVDGRSLSHLIDAVNGVSGRFFPWLGGQAAVVPNDAIEWLASQPEVASISLDRAVRGTLQRTTTGIGAHWVADRLGLDGAGVGVATIDSGVSAAHADLEGRVAQFVDFVNGQPQPYDDYGHGTHVAGIIAGNGHDSDGLYRGIAPGAHLIVLKALDVRGNGFTSNVIAAIDYAIANRDAFNIRVINLSVAAGVYESYGRDPLALAARRAVDAGIVVVAAAGNNGRDAAGDPVYGGIASPGNAPWVLTVGASSEMGTARREDDVVAPFSSRGPTAIDKAAKPDLVAPGVGIESTTEPSSALFAANPGSRLWGALGTESEPYLRLTGTSMSAPVVTAAIALMLQANPALTPNAVKAILQYTAESRDAYDAYTQGAGFLNARGAVELARAFASGSAALEPSSDPVRWSRRVIWGTRSIVGAIAAQANAWQLGVTWGAAATPGGSPVDIGVDCGEACGAAPAEGRR